MNKGTVDGKELSKERNCQKKGKVKGALREEKPLISVIVPVYNVITYLPKCVESIRSQTYQNLEILLVDDGSTDGTGEMCDRFGAKDSRIRVFHKENGGSSSARNLGIAQARGRYLGFVDSDDFIDTTMYEMLYMAAEKYQAKVVQAGRDEIDAEGCRLPDICVPPENTECISAEKFLEELLMHRGDCSFCTKLIRRELFEGREFPLGVLNEDFHLLLEMLEDIEQIISLPAQSYHVFYRPGSNSRKEGREEFSRVFGDCVENAKLAEELTMERYPALTAVAFRFGVFQRIEYMLHIPISRMTRDNEEYCAIVKDLRRCWTRSMRNPILTGKNKVYHTLFALAPKAVRQVHAILRRK